jgi:hypothetical protein
VSAPEPHDVEQALAALDRRAFLRLAGGLAAAGLLPAGCGGVPPALAPPPGHALRALSPRGYATFQAYAMRLLGPRVAAAITAGELDAAGAADAWVARQPALAAVLGRGLVLLEWGVWPLLPKGAPFTALDLAGQDRVIENLQRSRLSLKRDLYKGLKSLASLAVYTQPAAHRLVGYPGPFAAAGIAAAMADFEEEPPSPRPRACPRCAPACTSCPSASARACGSRCASTAARSWSAQWTTTSSRRPRTSPPCPGSWTRAS